MRIFLATLKTGKNVITCVAIIIFLLLSMGSIETSRAAISAIERSALIDLYNNTDGDNWANKTNWLGAAGTECAWYGATCNAGEAFVNGVNLNDNNLTGTIPTSIGNLTSLTHLSLWGNQLTGSIPSSIENLTALTYLSLSSNQLSGSIPPEIGNLTALTELHLSSNQLSDPIPSSIGNLLALTEFYLSKNQLSGSIPSSIGNLTSLTILALSNNQISGSIPPSIGNLTSITELYLSKNQLSGPIPSSIGNLTSLTVLYLWSNQLSGNIPASIINLPLLFNLSYFDYNALYSNNGSVVSFLDAAQSGGNWQGTQTIAPTNLRITDQTDSSVTLYWSPITYTADDGGYELWGSTVSGGPYTLITLLDFGYGKSLSNIKIKGPSASKYDYFVLRAWTDPHGNNTNKVTSNYSKEASYGNEDDASSNSGGCFIATAAYGSYSEAHVMVLREFRDNVLLKSKAGTALVNAYYAYSPPAADFIAAHPTLRVATRIALAPVIATVKSPVLMMAGVFAFTGLIAIKRRRRN